MSQGESRGSEVDLYNLTFNGLLLLYYYYISGILSYSMSQGESRGSEVDLYNLTYNGLLLLYYYYIIIILQVFCRTVCRRERVVDQK